MGGLDRVKINPQMLDHAMKTANTSAEALSAMLNMKPEKIHSWLSGNARPTMKQLMVISKKLGRSYYYFLLKKPPEEDPIPVDFRPYKGQFIPLKRETIVAIHEAKSFQDVAREIMNDLGTNPEPLFEGATLEDNPKEKAALIREDLGIITNRKRKEWSSDSKSFQSIREAVERLNVMVVTLDFPFEDARGFSLSLSYPFLIGISQKEPQKKAMNFTLLHELGHLLLRRDGICNPQEDISFDNGNREIEEWCNTFAAAVLVPEYVLRSEFSVPASRIDGDTLYNKVSDISSKYFISKQAVAIALVKINYIDKSRYAAFAKAREQKKKETKGGKSPPKWKRSLDSRGKRFSEIVYQGNESGYLTTSRALSYLSVPLKDFGKVREAISARR